MHKYDYQKNRRRALPEYISVISSSNFAKIKIDDIEVLEQDGRRVHIVTAARDYTFYGGLNLIAESLAERAFFRPIKSLIINFDHVSDITNYTINFNSGQSVSLGKNAMYSTRKAYKRYLMRYPPYTLWEPITLTAGAVAEPFAEDDDIVMSEDPDQNDTAPKLLN